MRRLTLRWSVENLSRHGSIKDWAETLDAELKRREDKFFVVGADIRMPDPRKRRFWHEVPWYSETGKAFTSEEVTWRIGYTERVLLLSIDFPDYQKYMVVNQSALEYAKLGVPRAYKAFDTERDDKAVSVLYEALHVLGIHPQGPNPPIDWDWDIAPA